MSYEPKILAWKQVGTNRVVIERVIMGPDDIPPEGALVFDPDDFDPEEPPVVWAEKRKWDEGATEPRAKTDEEIRQEAEAEALARIAGEGQQSFAGPFVNEVDAIGVLGSIVKKLVDRSELEPHERQALDLIDAGADRALEVRQQVRQTPIDELDSIRWNPQAQ